MPPNKEMEPPAQKTRRGSFPGRWVAYLCQTRIASKPHKYHFQSGRHGTNAAVSDEVTADPGSVCICGAISKTPRRVNSDVRPLS
jgi:hypothetical protein